MNPYTKLALKDDPALAGVMIWNENSIMGVNVFRITAKTPWHQSRYFEAIKAFAEKNGLPEATLKAPWTPQAKLVQNDIEYQWNHRAAEFLRNVGVKVPITADQIWGPMSSSSLPALTAGDVTDSHAYSRAEFINANPHYAGTPFQAFAWSHLADRPKTITEYNVSGVGEAAEVGCDAFTIMPYIAAMGGFQRWEASMLYAYSQSGLGGINTCSPWDSYNVAPLIGMAPAAALIYREGHVRPAEKTVYFPLSEDQSIYQATDQTTSRAARTVEERHRLLIGLDAIKELGWLKPTPAPADAEVVTDLQRDFIPPGDEVVSDTGELKRNWVNGTYVIDTPKTQLAMGRLKGETIRTADVTFTINSPEAAVALSSLDKKPLKESKRMLLTTAARMEYKDKHFHTEPVDGAVELKSGAARLQLVPLKGDGTEMTPIPLQQKAGVYHIAIPATLGTHWFLIEEKQ